MSACIPVSDEHREKHFQIDSLGLPQAVGAAYMRLVSQGLNTRTDETESFVRRRSRLSQQVAARQDQSMLAVVTTALRLRKVER